MTKAALEGISKSGIAGKEREDDGYRVYIGMGARWWTKVQQGRGPKIYHVVGRHTILSRQPTQCVRVAFTN